MILPKNLEIGDMQRGKSLAYSSLGDTIYNGFAFRGNTVLSMDKMIEFAAECMKYQNESEENVVIMQSTSGKGMLLMTVTLCVLK